MTAFYAKNPPMLHSEKSENSGMMEKTSLVAGHPAEIIDDRSVEIDAIENIGRPQDVFVHSADIARHLDCSLEAARRILDQFKRAGLLRNHGEIDVDVDGDNDSRLINLYRPDFDNPKEVTKTLYEMDGERPPNYVVATEEVTPGQFVQVEGSKFQFTNDDEVVIDVNEPDDYGQSIQRHVSDQLAEHGLAASSLKNFVYDLRKQADLV
jgi:hypothetical protein